MKGVLNWILTDEIGLGLSVSRKRFEKAMNTLESDIHYIIRRGKIIRIHFHFPINTKGVPWNG